MTKKNYKAVQEREYEQNNSLRKQSPTNCIKCDGYDAYCTKYIPLVQEYTSICITKVNLKPESRLEMMLK